VAPSTSTAGVDRHHPAHGEPTDGQPRRSETARRVEQRQGDALELLAARYGRFGRGSGAATAVALEQQATDR